MKRAAAFCLIGLAASLALARLAVFSVLGPLAGTLTVFPLVVGLLAAANQVSTGSADTTRSAAVKLGCGGGLLTLLALAQPELGLRYTAVLSSTVIFVLFVGLLAWQAYEPLRALGRSQNGTRDLGFFLVVVAVYAGIAPWSTEHRPPDGDEPYYLLMTHSLAYDLDADLANNYEGGDSLAFMPRRVEPQPGDPVGPKGEKFSRHNILMPLVLAPFYRLAGSSGALAVMILLAAALATVVLRTAELYFPERPDATLAAAGITAFGSPLLLQSHQMWVEVPAALLVAVGFEAASRLTSSTNPRLQLVKIFGAVLLLVFLKLRFLALAFPLLALALAHAPRAKRTALLRALSILMALVAAILLFNQISFGQALKHHSANSLLTYMTSPRDYLLAPLGLFFDSSFGLFFAAPIWGLVLPGAWATFRTRRFLFLQALVVCCPYLVLLGPRPEWYGGWSPFFRYGLVFLPFLALFLTPVLADRRKAGVGILIATLGTATAGLVLVWLVLPGWTYNFAEGRSHLLDHLTMVFGADIARLFPSWVRPRTANLVWPLLLLSLSTLAVLWRRKIERIPFAAGVAAVLSASALLVWLGTTLPTRAIEFEDPYVKKNGGRLWPDQWTPSRVAYRGSWLLEPGNHLQIPIRPAGEHVALEIDLRLLRPTGATTRLEVLADETPLLLLTLPRSREWSTVRLDPFPWPAGAASLHFRLVGNQGRLLLDRARLEWL